MMLTKLELRAVIFASVIVCFGLISVVLFFSDMNENGHKTLAVVEDTNARLTALEAGKTAATAKRFTRDDAKALMQCMKMADREKIACVEQVEAKFK